MIYLTAFSLLVSFLYFFFLKKIKNGLHSLKGIKTGNAELKSVSVLVPFRNESQNIINCYNSLVNQNYAQDKLEIIFIDDNSTDDSVHKLEKILKNQNIKILKLNNTNINKAFKKQAVKLGIEKSKGEIIVTTDADCTHPENWLSKLLSYYDDETALISGPVEFNASNSIFSQLQILEFAGLVLTGAGLIGSGRPIICNAANLTFRKNVFNEVGGYDDMMNLSSGDDELLMQKIAAANNYKIKFAFNRNAIVKTEANPNLTNFYQQRKRWASKSLFYKSKLLLINILVIFLFFLNLLLLPFFAIFINKYFVLLFMLEFFIKMFLEYRIVHFGKKYLFANLSMKLFLLAEIIHVPYIVISALSGIFGNYKWKNREVAR